MASQSDETVPPRRSPAFANAYAITYRLLGARQPATDAAARVATRFEAMEALPARQWLPDVAHDAVSESLSVAAGPEVGELLAGADDASTREAFRRRLAAADPPTWVAVGLHQLAGYPVTETAELMGFRTDTVGRLCAPFDPPPGVSWVDLGDPWARTATAVRRAPTSRRRLPLVPLVAAAVVLVLAVWAATSTGERPTVLGGSTTTLAPAGQGTTARFGPTVDPVPGAGCEQGTRVPGEAGVARGATLDYEGTTISYVLIAPASSAPAPLVVSLPDAGQAPAAFNEQTQLRQSLPGAVHVAVQPSPGDGISDAAAVAAVMEETIATRCVDLARVSVVGFGAGAVVAGDTACGFPELVSALAMVGGWREADDCELDPAVAVLVTARDDDPAVNTGSGLEEVGDAWAALVDAEPAEVEGRDETTLVREYTGPGDVTVTTVSRATGGHVWTMEETTDVTRFIAGTARLLG